MESTRKIYVLLTRFPGRSSMIIGMLTRFYYTHASIGLEEDMDTFYSFLGKGFVVEKVSRYVRPGRAPFPCQLYEMEVPEQVYQTIKRLLALFQENKTTMRYAKIGVALSLMRIPYKRRNEYFCSQFVAELLDHCQAIQLQKNSALFHPGDFRRMPGMHLHFQGNLRDMMTHFSLAPYVHPQISV